MLRRLRILRNSAKTLRVPTGDLPFLPFSDGKSPMPSASRFTQAVCNNLIMGYPLAVIAVAVVLVFGLVNMMRGGSPQTSQKLMRLRVLMQFVAIIVIMITIWAMGR